MMIPKTTIGFFLSALLIAGFLHGWNMFGFPYYESDEGTYISQAWSLVKQGDLSPYTYWYDHPPFGWIVMAGWAQLFGGDFFVFGESSVDHMRVFMLVVHILSSGLVYYITKRISRDNVVAFCAVIFFSVSPIFIDFQRRVFIDNLMAFWILASTASLFVTHLKLRSYIMSGIFLGCAILTKIPAVFFAPALFAMALWRPSDVSRSFRLLMWCASLIFIGMIFVLYAIIRGEFFPQSVTGGEHVSFMETFFFQLHRGGDSLHFWQQGSYFMNAFTDWTQKDFFTVVISIIAIFLGSAAMWYNKNMRFIMPFVYLFVFFLLRKGIVTNFYVIPLIPFLAIALAVGTHEILLALFHKSQKSALIAFLILFAAMSGYYAFGAYKGHFIYNETSNQIQATVWVKENLENDAVVITDAYNLVDLWDPDYINIKTFPHAEWNSKISLDPAIRDEKYGGDWRNVDYMIVNDAIVRRMSNPVPGNIIYDSLKAGNPVQEWTEGSSVRIIDGEIDSTHGNWTILYALDDDVRTQLEEAWNVYEENFVLESGRVVDHSRNLTTSEGQSYAMLRALWTDDQETFDRVWQWTRANLQIRPADSLFAWKWEGDRVTDEGNATDGDEDIALALLFAHKKWNGPFYLDDARTIISDLWEHNVVRVAGRTYFLPMHVDVAKRDDAYLLNPSYFSPAWYRIFAEVDPAHPWEDVARDTYAILEDISNMSENSTALPPDWVLVDADGTLRSARNTLNQDTEVFSYDAFRTLWRVSVDYQWHGDVSALQYLERVNAYLVPEYAKSGRLPSEIALDGTIKRAQDAVSINGGYLAALMYHDDPSVAADFYSKTFERRYDPNGKYWDSPRSYYGENWAWFGVGLYKEKLPNLWE